MNKPLWQNKDGFVSRGIYIPQSLCVCPECHGELAARAMAWETDTGRPYGTSIEIDCMNELRDGGIVHAWHQCEWQSVRDKIAVWSDAK